MVSFTGPTTGSIAFSMPDGLARGLFVAFLGLEPEAAIDDGALGDFLGEFANMSCGAWLTSLELPECFAIASPVVGPFEGLPDPESLAVVMVNDGPVVIHASLA